MENYIWAKDKLVGEIRFTAWTSDGALRQADAALRDDEAAGEVELERRGSESAEFTAVAEL